ncbi:MAG: hypothetical protein IPN69_08200 [Acidobacteria bacterium]|nr:hypothetical protein [Acidobacteriota bacterium]
MDLLTRLRIAIAAFRRAGGIELPDGNGRLGRSSDESFGTGISTMLSRFQTISPVIDFEMLALLKKFYLFNPDVSQFVSNLQNLANNGHTVSVDATTDARAEAAVNRLNEAASRLFPLGAGVDGLLNAYLAQIAWSGALSSEDVVNFAGRRVEKVVLVPVESIRFKYDEENFEYRAYQRTTNYARRDLENLNLIRLSTETYRYLALQTVENNPYAKPPATAAIDSIIQGQEPILKNIQHIAQKFGLAGLVTASVMPPPKKPNETDAEYQGRAKSYLKMIATSLEGQFSKGLLVSFRDQKLEHANIAEGARGVYDLNRISEEQVMSGLAMQPAFFGRTDSTTETYADVVYNLLLAQVHNIQRLVKRRQEATYRLDLRLGGIEVDGVSLSFNKPFSRNALADAQTGEIEIRNVLEKVRAGLISPDEGAQELGYESWFDEQLLETAPTAAALMRDGTREATKFNFRYAKSFARYEFVQPRLTLAGREEKAAGGNVFPLKKKAKA